MTTLDKVESLHPLAFEYGSSTPFKSGHLILFKGTITGSIENENIKSEFAFENL
jgi:hypothetical protein